MAPSHDHIRQLIDRYFEGESSLEEEQAIKSFYAETDGLPDDLERLRPMFEVFARHSHLQQPSTDFSDKLNALLLQESAPTEPPALPIRRRTTLIRARLIRAAAVLLPIAGFWLLTHLQPRKSHPGTRQVANATISDPEQAYAVLENALLLASAKMQKGTLQAAGQVRRIQHTTSFFQHANREQ